MNVSILTDINQESIQQFKSDNIVSSEKSIYNDNQNNIINPNFIYVIGELHKKLDNFFINEVWEIKNINNYKIRNLFELVNNLKKKISHKTTFNIDMFYHLEISSSKESKKEINKEVSKVKKDNLSILKIHGELFKDYHKIYNELYKILLNQNYEYDIYFCKDSLNRLNQINKGSEYIKIEKINKEDITLHNGFIETFSSLIQNELRDKLISKLEDNISKIELPNFNDIDDTIILFDSENILKSFRIHEILKNNIDDEKLNYYYQKWIYGDKIFNNKINESMSLTEFSNSVRFIEPFTSLCMDIHDKIFLCKIIISNYLADYFVICMINSKNTSNDNTQSILEDNILFINIVHDKYDIREQDDHLILYLNYYLKQLEKKVLILSSDNYKFFLEKIVTFDFKVFYDFDSMHSKIILSNSEHDLINVNGKKTQLIINNISPINLADKNSSKEHILFDIIYKILTKKEEDFMYELEKILKEINKELKILVNFFDEIFSFLESKSKKEIFKIMLSEKEIFQSDYKNNFSYNIEKFKSIINVYLILKFIKLIFFKEKIIEIYIMIFEKIIYIYDKIDDSIDKIRKLSNGLGSSNMFSILNSTYLMIKKIGLFKKVL